MRNKARHRIRSGPVHAALVACLALAASAAWAQVPGEKSVQGIVVRIGVAAAEQLVAHPSAHLEKKMHGGPAAGRVHLVVSLEEQSTRRRIDDAQVTVSISRSGVDHRRRALDRMPALDATTYGGYFDLRQPGPYTIRVEVERRLLASPAIAEFRYDPQ